MIILFFCLVLPGAIYYLAAYGGANKKRIRELESNKILQKAFGYNPWSRCLVAA
jgi:hypothetical protein